MLADVANLVAECLILQMIDNMLSQHFPTQYAKAQYQRYYEHYKPIRTIHHESLKNFLSSIDEVKDLNIRFVVETLVVELKSKYNLSMTPRRLFFLLHHFSQNYLDKFSLSTFLIGFRLKMQSFYQEILVWEHQKCLRLQKEQRIGQMRQNNAHQVGQTPIQQKQHVPHISPNLQNLVQWSPTNSGHVHPGNKDVCQQPQQNVAGYRLQSVHVVNSQVPHQQVRRDIPLDAMHHMVNGVQMQNKSFPSRAVVPPQAHQQPSPLQCSMQNKVGVRFKETKQKFRNIFFDSRKRRIFPKTVTPLTTPT